MKAGQTVLLLLIVAGLVAGLWWLAHSGGSGGVASVADAVSEDGVLATCDSSTTPDLDINAYDIDQVGTAVTEATNLYRKQGDKTWTAWTQGTAITNLVVGGDYEFVMGISTSDFTDNAYGPYFEVDNIPCKELTVMEKGVAQDEVETSLSATFYNADASAAAEVFTADQTQTVSLKLLAGSNEYFGNPYIADFGGSGGQGQRADFPNVVCLDLNSTAWDAPEKVFFDGEEMRRVSTPLRHTPVATDITYCYEAPVMNDALMESDRYMLRLNADASSAPSQDDTAFIYAANFYINADTGEVEWGIENEDGTAVGTDAADSVTLDFT